MNKPTIDVLDVMLGNFHKPVEVLNQGLGCNTRYGFEHMPVIILHFDIVAAGMLRRINHYRTAMFERIDENNQTDTAIGIYADGLCGTPTHQSRSIFCEDRHDRIANFHTLFHNIFADFILLRRSSKLPETLRTAMQTQPIRTTAPEARTRKEIFAVETSTGAADQYFRTGPQGTQPYQTG